MELKKTIRAYGDELFLYSGQYALFYILMNLSNKHLGYFSESSHIFLILALALQTAFLVKFGQKPKYRFFGSLIAPLAYTLFEIQTVTLFLINTGHLFFWFFSLLTGWIQAWELRTKNKRTKNRLDIANTMINVFIFVFIYFYFDLIHVYTSQLEKGVITSAQYTDLLEFYTLSKGVVEFFRDATHVYVSLGGLLLAISLAIGRSRIFWLKERINELFGQYVDQDVRDKIIQETGSLAESKNVAILFSDIRGFTTLTEENPAEDIVRMLNIYFAEWDKSARAHGGIIDKFIGDAVMIIFEEGKSVSASNRAVSCARELVSRLSLINSKLAKQKLPIIGGIGVGINQGKVILGNIGSESRKNYTAIGDNVNIAARLESQCKQYEKSIILSDSVYSQLSSKLKAQFATLGKTALKGKKELISIYGS